VSRRTIKRAAVIVLVLLCLAGAYSAGVYHGSWRGAEDGFNKGYLQGRKGAVRETIKEKTDTNRLFLQS
jgi:hypothetical protein